ncbi:DNA-binding response regulator [Pseudoduganella sp. FT25W]|uniref:DNA-binding response regulator n=1 Tax=Duganella alba TaxID=2666081 RepID=A0A6L5QPS3_9BURK|nr:response regulator transcription factor [Duganella alba]MRX11864.1 DNA-binding response regulator [Duganella alba]MRX20247.1 DNA-binding response regulator [Duganella alba]
MNRLMNIRVTVRHEDQLIRSGIGVLLDQYADIALTLLPPDQSPGDEQADVLILDYRQAVTAYAAQHLVHGPAVLIVTHHDREWDLRDAFRAGASGYLLQHCDASQLVAAVRTLALGGRYVAQALSGMLAVPGQHNLTTREDQVLRLLAQGCCNKEIARELGIGVGTVKAHTKGVFSKLGATARTHAVALATKRGMLSDLHYASRPRPQSRA